MSTTDHITMANHHLSLANGDGITAEGAQAHAAIALTQATLALVEEQRTTNLLLWLAWEPTRNVEASEARTLLNVAHRLGLSDDEDGAR